ncbi:DUF982 domain-containing protein [Pseudomonas sp. R2.Fl]|nr:DUF982 domain-containing protein [Pseudomonas sp. R2.Fl]
MPFDRPFHLPIILVIAGARHVVHSVREAAWLLAETWPDVDSKRFRAALAACAAAMEGRIAAAQARRAVVEAAHAAGVPVQGELSDHQVAMFPAKNTTELVRFRPRQQMVVFQKIPLAVCRHPV